jgi:hypothetical protein
MMSQNSNRLSAVLELRTTTQRPRLDYPLPFVDMKHSRCLPMLGKESKVRSGSVEARLAWLEEDVSTLGFKE